MADDKNTLVVIDKIFESLCKLAENFNVREMRECNRVIIVILIIFVIVLVLSLICKDTILTKTLLWIIVVIGLIKVIEEMIYNYCNKIKTNKIILISIEEQAANMESETKKF